MEAQARGEEELARLERALTRVDDATKKARNTTLEIAGTIAAVTAAFKAATASAGAFVAANIATEASMQRTLNTYRALRLAIAAPGGAASIGIAAGTVAGGYAIQKIIETTVERARQVQGASFSAASTGSSFQSAYTLQRASTVTGRDLGFLNGYSAQDISEVTLKLRGIEDPILRAQEAIRLFGKDGETALGALDGRLSAAAARAADLAEELDGPTRNSLNQFKSAFDNFHPFQQIGDEFDNFAERFKIGVAKLAIDGVNAFQRMAQANQGMLYSDPTGGAEAAGFNPGDPVPSDGAFTRQAREFAAARLLNIGVPSVASTALMGSASGVVARNGSSREAVAAELAAAQKSLGGTLALFNGGDVGQKASLSSALVQQEAAVTSLTAKLKGMDEALRKVQEREALLASLPELARKADLGSLPRMARLRGEKSDFSKKLGPGFDFEVNAIFGPQERDEAVRLKNEAVDSLGRIDQARMDFARDIDRQREESARDFSQQLSKKISVQEKEVGALLQRLDLIGASDAAGMTRNAQGAVRRATALAGPGDEAGLIGFEFSTRIKLAKDLYSEAVRRADFEKDEAQQLIALDRARADFAREDGDARLDREVKILELARRRKDEARGLASDFVGSIQSGDPSSFFKQQGGRLLNQVGTNALTGTFQRVQGTLGRIGAASGLGGLLSGTILDPANATPIDKNTLATERNTAALERSNGGGTVGGGISGMLGKLGLPTGVLFGAGANPLIFSAANKSAVTPAPGFIGLGTTEAGAVVPLGGGLSKTARGVGIAGAVAGGAIGAYTQFKAGGAQGALNGSAAIAGAAASIIALSGATGPAAPILAGVALGLQGIAMILGDPKKKRDAQINQRLTDAYYDEADPMSYSMDRLGRSYDTNKLGGLREITVNISALDSRSIVDSRESIADALRMAIYEGHGINRAMQEAVGAA